jgi:hypothetical protein
MKMRPSYLLSIALFTSNVQTGHSQAFTNLNFESAVVTGHSAGDSIPAANAFPGWNVSLAPVYNGISLGAPAISIIDSAAPLGAGPLQGKYSAFLFGSLGVTAEISQTGLIPAGTESVRMDVYTFYGFTVMLDGQPLTMVPLSSTSSYTVYGADIPAYAGETATLSLDVPPIAEPNAAEFDGIVFSPQSTPEPSTWALILCGAGVFALKRRAKRR